MEELEKLLTIKLNLSLNIKLLKEEMSKWTELDMDHTILFDEMYQKVRQLRFLYESYDTEIMTIIKKMSVGELYVSINKVISTIA